MKSRYSIQEIEETTTWTYDKDGDGIPDTKYDEGIVSPGDVEDAYAALKSNCWDSLDIRSDEVICYPADSYQHPGTGADSRTQIIIKGDGYDVECLMNYYFRKVHRAARS